MTDREHAEKLTPPYAYLHMGDENKTMLTWSSGFVLGKAIYLALYRENV